MIDIYKSKGMSDEDSKTVVDLLFESKKAFLDVMMIEELQMMPAESGGAAWKGALATFLAFLVLGGLPMLPYLFSGMYLRVAAMDAVFWVAVALFSVALFALGAFKVERSVIFYLFDILKGRITGKRWYFTGFTMLVNGGVTTVISYVVGYLLGGVVN